MFQRLFKMTTINNFVVRVIIVITCFYNGLFNYSVSAQFSDEFQQNFGQNLTEEIDKVLREDDPTAKDFIRETLQWTASVYYESDILLNDIEDMIPVLDLLDDLKPNSATPFKLTLSLPYLNKTCGGFNRHRMKDIYYSLEKDFAPTNTSKIINSLESVVLNFVPPYPHDPYDRSCSSFINFPNKYRIIKYFKNFISLYFGQNTISVGIMYDQHFPDDIFRRQTPPADFLIYYVEVDFSKHFPLLMHKFQGIMHEYLSAVPQTATLFINYFERPNQLENYLWNYDRFEDIKRAVVELPQYQNTSERFMSQYYETVAPTFNYIFNRWANAQNRNFILGRPFQKVSSEDFPKNVVRSELVLHYIDIEEAETDVCDIRRNFSLCNGKDETIIVTQDTRRAFARFNEEKTPLLDSCLRLSKSIAGTYMTKVMMRITGDICEEWSYLEKYMVHLLLTYPKISQMYLDTIIFSDQDLKESLEMQSFANFTKTKYKLGCVIQFESIIDILGNFYDLSDTTFNFFLESSLCQPIFPVIDVLIIRVSSDDIYSYDGHSNEFYSSDITIFLIREIFQSYFPQMQILLEFPAQHIHGFWANLYNVSLVVQ